MKLMVAPIEHIKKPSLTIINTHLNTSINIIKGVQHSATTAGRSKAPSDMHAVADTSEMVLRNGVDTRERARINDVPGIRSPRRAGCPGERRGTGR